MSSHNYAGCERAPCAPCESYGDGWAHGKAKMADELLAVARADHVGNCACRPCVMLRSLALIYAIQAAKAGDDDAELVTA